MRFTSTLAALGLAMGTRAETHGEGDEGTIMGPVAFLWPDDRNWTAAYDNTAQGEVALSIADDAWRVAFYISFDNDPTSQSDFTEQIVSNVTEIEPGHQCYKIDSLPSTVAAGSNATIQLEYWAHYEEENNGNNETFYACADVYFVEASDFSVQVPCFNVTAESFDSTVTATSSAATVTSTSSSSSGSSGLSKGAIAGIAVGTIVGSLAIVGAAAFMLFKKRKTGATPSDAPMQLGMTKKVPDTGSVISTH
ncbi:hypothetical protein M406DRAFT_66997 [Cryphonectria parasitica EP155]|uniref:Copper acquisition factor BIM1-like domain-containing protein n=1 Tax=Cryphonectria parasitica (strain ATCC 38755 / EP155) TaxID=660469 RepID=A0A9P4YCQ9_CRYP1|nr:uncharacterized protein M406DRAFT_66997 [Cryphonectria parasitica EP155]KAF3770594.1 hypothetical protein M406DRAFT_66997 [Cryphonectria parasitica EP155]